MTFAPRDIESVFCEIFHSRNTILEVKMMTGDASPRKYFRISTTNKETYVLQQSDPFHGENSFSYGQKLFKLAEIRVPEILGRCGQKGWMLLEDLGVTDFQGQLNAKHLSLAINPLRKLFAFDIKEAKKIVPQAPHWAWFFDVEKLTTELNFFKKHFLETYLGEHDCPDVFFGKVCAHLSARPRILCHRDYHSRNIMNFNGECVVIDFQDARLGPASYDWVSILWDPYSPLPGDLEEKGMNEFLTLHQRFLGVTKEESELEFWFCMLQRMLKAVGSYASFKNLQGKSQYLQYIEPALKNSQHAVQNLLRLGALSTDDKSISNFLDTWLLLNHKKGCQ